MIARAAALALLAPLLASCAAILGRDLPEEPPPLAAMREPLDRFAEPDDEAARTALPLGCFSGLAVEPAHRSLEGEAEGLRVAAVVENSPADAAGLREDDILLAVVDAAGERALAYPAQWREIELAAAPGSEVSLVVDRAGAEAEARLRFIPRVRPPGRSPVERYREEDRVGVVLRTATEVEARAAGLPPGSGAVVVGLTDESPWRAAGLAYGDLIAEVGSARVDHPQVVLDAVREGEDEVALAVVRGAERLAIDAPLSRRQQEMTRLYLPPLVSYESDRGATELSILLGTFRHRTTAAAWDLRLLWLFSVSGGDADRLEEVDAK